MNTNKVIEIDMTGFWNKEAVRKLRKEYILGITKPQSTKAIAIASIISDIINDAADGYAFKDGHDDIMITDAVKRIVKLIDDMDAEVN